MNLTVRCIFNAELREQNKGVRMLVDKKTLEDMIWTNLSELSDNQIDDLLWDYYHSPEQDDIELAWDEYWSTYEGPFHDIRTLKNDDEMFWQFVKDYYVLDQVRQFEAVFKEIEEII